MTTKENLVHIITQHQATSDAGDAGILADTIINELLKEEWMVADIAEDGSIDGGSMYEDENAEEEARAYHARVSTWPKHQKLLHRKVTVWEEVTP